MEQVPGHVNVLRCQAAIAVTSGVVWQILPVTPSATDGAQWGLTVSKGFP